MEYTQTLYEETWLNHSIVRCNIWINDNHFHNPSNEKMYILKNKCRGSLRIYLVEHVYKYVCICKILLITLN